MTGVGFVSRSAEDTHRFGARLARELPEGTVVALVGELGAGKTVLVQGAAAGLGVGPGVKSKSPGSVTDGVAQRKGREGDGDEGDVISPTFVLVREHVGDAGRRLVHVDAHRLGGPGGLEALGIDDVFGQAGVAFVEWADRVYDALPRPCLVIRLAHESEGARRLELGGIGAGHEELVGLAARVLKDEAGPGRRRAGDDGGGGDVAKGDGRS